MNDSGVENSIVAMDDDDLKQVLQFQSHIARFPQIEFQNKHYFAKGLYARELFIPAGTIIVGKMHRYEHLDIMAYGDISVFIPGYGVERLQGYRTMFTEPGTKRAAYAHADTMWITLHHSDERDLEKLEDELIVPDPIDALEGDLTELLSHVGDV